MKNLLIIILIIFFCMSCTKKNTHNETIYSDTDNNIVFDEIVDNNLLLNNTEISIWEYIEHIQKAEVYNNKSLVVYEKHGFNEEIINILTMGAEIDINELAIETNNDQMNFWLKISYEDIQGWIYGGYGNPYRNGIGTIIETINIGDKTWTVRTIGREGYLAADGLNVRDKPGLENTNVIFQIKKSDYGNTLERKWGDFYYEMIVAAIAQTIETDTINGVTEYWVKIIDKFDREGWVFGGFLEMGDRGGAKYFTPETYIFMELNPP